MAFGPIPSRRACHGDEPVQREHNERANDDSGDRDLPGDGDEQCEIDQQDQHTGHDAPCRDERAGHLTRLASQGRRQIPGVVVHEVRPARGEKRTDQTQSHVHRQTRGDVRHQPHGDSNQQCLSGKQDDDGQQQVVEGKLHLQNANGALDKGRQRARVRSGPAVTDDDFQQRQQRGEPDTFNQGGDGDQGKHRHALQRIGSGAVADERDQVPGPRRETPSPSLHTASSGRARPFKRWRNADDRARHVAPDAHPAAPRSPRYSTTQRPSRISGTICVPLERTISRLFVDDRLRRFRIGNA